MRQMLLAISVLALCCGLILSVAGIRAKEKEKVLFSRAIGDIGQSLVITQGIDRDKSLFGFWKGKELEETQSVYEIRAEIRSPNADPVLLASFLRVESFPNCDRGVVVLDVFEEPRLITACVAVGPELKIWHIGGLYGCSAMSPGPPATLWTRRAAPSPISDKLVEVKMSRLPDEAYKLGNLLFEVVDKWDGEHSIFEDGNEWNSCQLKLVRQWRDKK